MEVNDLQKYDGVVFEHRDYRDYELILETPHTHEEGILNPVLASVAPNGFSIKFNGARKYDPNTDIRLKDNAERKKKVIAYIVNSPHFASGIIRVYDSSNETVTMTKAQLARLQEDARKQGATGEVKK